MQNIISVVYHSVMCPRFINVIMFITATDKLSCLLIISTWISTNQQDRFNIKMPSYQYRNGHYKDTMVSWESFLYNGNTYTCKTRSWYRNDPYVRHTDWSIPNWRRWRLSHWQFSVFLVKIKQHDKFSVTRLNIKTVFPGMEIYIKI